MSKSDLKSKKSTILTIRPRRHFSEEFKREKVKELTSNLYSIRSFCKLWEVSSVTVYRWIYKYSPSHKQGTIMVIQKESEALRTAELLIKVSDLERTLGQKQMQIDFLEKLVEIAGKKFEIDLKKNFNLLDE
jgi:transposase